MNQSILSKLEQLSMRLEEINALLSDQSIASDQNKFRELSIEHSQLTPVNDKYKSYLSTIDDIEAAEKLLSEQDDEMKQMAEEEISSGQKVLEQLELDLKKALLPKDPNDSRNIILEIRAGTGGDEASIFAGEIFRMYQRYTELQNWSFKLVDMNDNGLGGIKEVTFEINGSGVFRKMKHEAGTHRVQRVRSTESQGRIHTSAVTVAVLPRLEDINITINQEDIRTDIFHSGGAGGQNVNKVATAVRLTHNPSGIVVTCQRERSQSQNRLIAMDLLKVRLWDLEYQKQQLEHSKNRKDQVGSGDRSEKIRTYNFPQGRVTDHRINESVYNLDEFLNGSIDILIDKLIRNEQIKKLSENEDN